MYHAGLDPERIEAYFTRIVAPDMTPAAVDEALRTGPYGRCVWASDNDVVDHQVVNLEYANGVTAAFTVVAATRHEDRRTSIFGSRGQITTDGSTVEVYDFARRKTTAYDVTGDGSGHGGGDAAMLARLRGHPPPRRAGALHLPGRSQPGHPPDRVRRRAGAAERHRRRALNVRPYFEGWTRPAS